ncbi:hypothetical protein C5C03_06490 [Clavibacter michiganensis]|uniref:hypothetical protein n=1 Tax=Clavibacter michiganensis TaxID=28447 RepID=UPI000CE7F022|nr:hypothetical protein [Clavibacter michiganensis]PPF88643.1 hypothetical protein C5C03_06490 [Clavibacter michiganensis]PPF96268.1 hypothetical protein C5C05_07370 [Clavibacter michiganensis]
MTARTVFVISPIGSPGTAEHRQYWLTLEYIIKRAFEGEEWEVVRADEETAPDSITTQVIGRIVEADLIVADLTDHNPNVFYELAVAHGYEKPVIHLMQDGQKVPFDVVDQRVIFYDLANPESVDKARLSLAASVKWLDEKPGQSRNPLSAYGRFSVISAGSEGGDAGVAVAEAIEGLSRQMARMEARLSAEPLRVKSNDALSTRTARLLAAREHMTLAQLREQESSEGEAARARAEERVRIIIEDANARARKENEG